MCQITATRYAKNSKKQESVPGSKLSPLWRATGQMLFIEILTFIQGITKNINTLCGLVQRHGVSQQVVYIHTTVP
jgi:hypothetical protein